MTFLIGSGSGFSGDRIDAAIPVVNELAQRKEPSAIIFETLGERTLAAAQKRRQADPESGFEPFLHDLLSPILHTCVVNRIPIIGNFGAANPVAAGHLICRMLNDINQQQGRVAIITGDDIRERLHCLDLKPWENETGILPEMDSLLSANVYLGAGPIVEALSKLADVIVAGRVADSALALAPLQHHFGWSWDDWDHIAAGIVAGHLIECGAQVTGGYFADPGFKDVPDLARVGYPIIEVEESGRMVITKPAGTGGCVTEQTVKEQLIYEIHDPSCYLTPDVVVDFSDVVVQQLGPDRVEVKGVRGRPAPETLKTTVCYQGAWQSEAEISYSGHNALGRARLAARVLESRLDSFIGEKTKRRIDFIGHVSVFGDDKGSLQNIYREQESDDIRLRLSVEHDSRNCVEKAAHEVLSLYCTGPAGGGGVRSRTLRRVNTRSFLISREEIAPAVTMTTGEKNAAS